ncbi:uncharacterized protein PHACADRAFT_189534 [Phanerochaete carnosa HHB-10118-sp]|uniref:F-box domain-containing protein n=1 Tax=Phanerochaete carnosa (strain HHB-10118-sp) TaxID=650164 RepID=K5WLV8_PHACS|nr:uncharacterized protein PHACADRAFT_189534 [Phanerochaete carnosa HHB-10118-sp]EKM60400.1 hypothetical protein PHACADRAFT_189534 [Phanerochaete carnosa HHB-10118-sp]
MLENASSPKNELPRKRLHASSSISMASHPDSRDSSTESTTSSVSLEETKKGHYAWCEDPKPFHQFIRHWERLPTELHDYVYDLLASAERKVDLSTLSLVSRAWCRHFRPHLFTRLTLQSEEDCRMLYNVVRSPLSAWLVEHITKLLFYRISPPSYPLCTALLRLLPACRHTLHSFSFKSDRVSLSHNAALKSSLRSITSLTLWDCRFPSFRILLRILGDITYLEKVDFLKVEWSDDRLTTASNICTGAFSYIRTVKINLCTNNLAVPAWILAATSTRHSFTRRRTAGPAVSAEMWAIIELIQTFLSDSASYNSGFDVKEATTGELNRSLHQIIVLTECSQDTYRFVGSLAMRSLEGATAYISVQVIKSAPPAGGNETWSVCQIVLADSTRHRSKPHSYLLSRDWSKISSLLPEFLQLQQLQVLCGENYPEEDFRALSDKVVGGMNNRTRPLVMLQHDPGLPDGRYLQPALFDLTEKDVEAGQDQVMRAGKRSYLQPTPFDLIEKDGEAGQS